MARTLEDVVIAQLGALVLQVAKLTAALEALNEPQTPAPPPPPQEPPA